MSDQPFRFSGEAARSYDQYLGPFLFEPSARIMSGFLPEDYQGNVLELAAGTGRLTRHLIKKLGSQGRLTASDLSPDMLEIAEQKLSFPNLQFVVADAQQLPFPDDHFDFVFFQYGIMFLPDKGKGMAEAWRVLKPGGKLFMSTWDATDRMPFFHLLFNETLLPFFRGGDMNKYILPFLMHDPNALTELFRNAGFGKINIHHRRFQGTSPAPSELAKGFLLNHPMGKEVMEQDPDALMPMADQLQQRIAERFGQELVTCELSAFFCEGEK
jgi:ubiquinone/menaquinone biosynthesis C-methylase UbiE